MVSKPALYYRRRAVDALRLLVGREAAVSWPEVEAKIADQPLPGLRQPTEPRPFTLDPHHLSTARYQLVNANEMVYEERVTRGRRSVAVLHPTDLSNRHRRTQDAAARKRLLTARYFGWSQASAHYPRGRMGPAGETVLHRSLREAAPTAGYQLLNPERGETARALGHEIAEGPLDNAALLYLTGEHGRPTGDAVLLMIEVKNVRPWLYPRAEQIYQVLHKAAMMQEREPDFPIVPVLIARRLHYLTWTMAKDLGLYLINTRRQYMLSSGIEDRHLEEVRNELGLRFLTPTTNADDDLTHRLAHSLPPWAMTAARAWSETGARFADHYDVLRRSLSDQERHDAFDEFRETAREDAGCVRAWTTAGP